MQISRADNFVEFTFGRSNWQEARFNWFSIAVNLTTLLVEKISLAALPISASCSDSCRPCLWMGTLGACAANWMQPANVTVMLQASVMKSLLKTAKADRQFILTEEIDIRRFCGFHLAVL